MIGLKTTKTICQTKDEGPKLIKRYVKFNEKSLVGFLGKLRNLKFMVACSLYDEIRNDFMSRSKP
uniref:Uncharacterized protein n=1 Tax=Helianthus annuus TaxID=4232 RepID=A0A251UPA0_HELAN